jgi:predicted NAD/FAD-binding protein
MKIAIIGSGISGLTCAYLLNRKHDVHVFEANDYIGGHTRTVDVKTASGDYAIDTGFIVFNNWTYPNFIKLMNSIGVESQDTSMSFSVKSEISGLEYNGTSLNSLFAQRSNLLRPSFYRMIKDILRFNKESLEVLEDSADSVLSLGDYLIKKKYSVEFINHYIIPMGGAIWSSSVEQMKTFPIKFFVQFFKNHGMLSVDERPVWRVIKKGSRSYIHPLTKSYKDKIRLKSPVVSVKRTNGKVVVQSLKEGQTISEEFDQVIFACHSDQTMSILKDATDKEKAIYSGFQYQPNSVILHTDESLLPKRKLAWAAWNYLIPNEKNHHVAVTYDMNILQGITAPETFCVSLNLDSKIDPKKILRKFVYDHPVYSLQTVKSQSQWSEISGHNSTHFCGAYWSYGFHEDGVKSALKVCEYFQESL